MWSTNVKKSAVKFNLLAYKREEQSKVWIENGHINSFQLSFKRETFFHPRERFINFDSMNFDSCSSRNSKVLEINANFEFSRQNSKWLLTFNFRAKKSQFQFLAHCIGWIFNLVFISFNSNWMNELDYFCCSLNRNDI